MSYNKLMLSGFVWWAGGRTQW